MELETTSPPGPRTPRRRPHLPPRRLGARAAASLLALLVLSASVLVLAPSAPAASQAVDEVRAIVRKHVDGYIEFGIRTPSGDRVPAPACCRWWDTMALSDGPDGDWYETSPVFVRLADGRSLHMVVQYRRTSASALEVDVFPVDPSRPDPEHPALPAVAEDVVVHLPGWATWSVVYESLSPGRWQQSEPLVVEWVADASSSAASVRIAARKLANGKIEFGLEKPDGELWLPDKRYFPYATAAVGRWLRASPYGMSDGNDVRIRARKLADGGVEFALQVGDNRQWLPSARRFPYPGAAIGRWLYSSRYTVGDPLGPLAAATSAASPHSPPTPAAPGASGACTFERSMRSVVGAVFQAVVTTAGGTGGGTAFYIGNGEFLTAAHVVEGARSVRLQNHERTLTGVQIVGVHAASDMAILRADAPGISPLRFGDESSIGRGARIAVVGYPGALGIVKARATIVSGLLSAKWALRGVEGGVELQTDAAANPGNSGGPLIDVCGQVLGIIVSGIRSAKVEGLAFAVSERTVQALMPTVRQRGTQPSSDTAIWLYGTYRQNGEPYIRLESTDYEYFVANPGKAPLLVLECTSRGEPVAVVDWGGPVWGTTQTIDIEVAVRFDSDSWGHETWRATSRGVTWTPDPLGFSRQGRRSYVVTFAVAQFNSTQWAASASFPLESFAVALQHLPCY